MVNWQTATGKDAASLSVAPNFVSDTDLHLDLSGPASPIENAGVFLAAVPLDIDAEQRHPSTPDIGADELSCHAAVPSETCDDLNACTSDSCNAVTGCVNTTGNAGAVCRAAAGDCDVAETCDGSSPACPADGFSTGNECRASAGICDVAESCTGSSACVPGGCVPAELAGVPRVGRSMRRGGIVHRVVGDVPGGRLRRCLDGLHG